MNVVWGIHILASTDHKIFLQRVVRANTRDTLCADERKFSVELDAIMNKTTVLTTIYILSHKQFLGLMPPLQCGN